MYQKSKNWGLIRFNFIHFKVDVVSFSWQLFRNFFVSNQYSRLDDADPEIENLIQFITGSPSIPPLGLPDDISILFKHGCINADCKCFPTVSTCDLQLCIPVHITSEDKMKESLSRAVKEGYCFGQL